MSKNNTETAPVGDGTLPAGDGADPTGAPPVEPGANAGDTSAEPKVYDEAYVKKLRDEAAEHRVKATRAADAEQRLHNIAIAQAVSGILTSSDDLVWSDEYTDEAGWPHEAKIIQAAEDLVARKPYLGRPRGDVGQGQQSDSASQVSLSEILRAGA